MCITEIPQLLYYAYIPSILLGLFFGLFVFFSNKKDPTNRILFLISIAFSLYSIVDFSMWFPMSVRIFEVLQDFLMLVLILLPLLIYFVYSLFSQKISKWGHFLIWIPLIPLYIINFSKYNDWLFTIYQDGTNCVVQESTLYPYVYALGIFYFFWVVLFLAKKYRAEDVDLMGKKKIKIVVLAAFALIGWFLLLIYLQNFFGDNALLFVPFGMLMFIAILSYAIVKYNLLNIKLIAAQVLVFALVVLIGSQFFFIKTDTNRILTAITFLIASGFGFMLIKSVREEVRRKEELQLMADKLASANDELRKLDNAKSEFISIASHQLRTPLTAIKGFLSLLLEGTYGELAPPVSNALNKVYISSENLIQLVEDLLNVSRIESGRMDFKVQRESLAPMLKTLHENFTLIAKEKELYLDLKLPKKNLPEIMADSSKIREVVSNLVDNALKYTKKGGVTIRAEVGKSISPNGIGQGEDAMRIIVSDTGIGVPATEIPYLFKKFSRGKDIDRLHAGGTGLGLYVGKNIVEAHKGKIWLESEGEGRGSKFIIELPIEE